MMPVMGDVYHFPLIFGDIDVVFQEYDEETGWPIVEFVYNDSFRRLTTIDPVLFERME